jgi:hypothetical protein
VLQVQWGRIKVNCTHLRTFIGFAKLTWSPKSTISYIHWVFGVAAYLVRRRYFLWFGGHSAPHPIRDIVNCFTNPLAFWETNTYDWWWWAKYIFWQNVGNGILYLCIGQTRRGTHAFLPSVFVTFWALCVLERGVCAIVNATCVPLSLISFVFQDAEMVKEFVKLSLRYWSVSLLAIINWGTGLLATTRLGGWGMLLMLLLTAGFLWSIVSFQDAFWDSFFTLIYPLRMGLWVAIRGALLVYLPVLKFVGIVLTLIMMFAGAAFFTSFCADPLQLKDTKALTEAAARRARNMLPTRQPFRIGEYTGAGRRARSPTRASTNLSAWTSPAASASPQPVPQLLRASALIPCNSKIRKH